MEDIYQQINIYNILIYNELYFINVYTIDNLWVIYSILFDFFTPLII